ncbi:UdgX family uracil-DNA binding protein [Ornithinimicrobium cavernae]|uniref:UdgX family uracil-DNA binding protein n=1 Tax=Ornithinimicrobium cavernae TaxID=2666047 RepID=UPI000D6864FB|nr:UdgX family uracil-DNA binding protein [Ornithinimicrobium cavernae]
MSEAQDASAWVPARPTLPRLAEAVQACRGCELWEDATQAVLSSGGPGARVMLVGVQPGDQEDRRGEPFVGPAGGVLTTALEAAGIEVGEAYLTNAVKHFRFRPRGRRRIHEAPELRHLVACHPWLEAELGVVDPDVVVCLGASAGRAVLGRRVRIGAERGKVLEGPGGRATVITTHPSAVLRLRARGGYDEALAELVADLRVAASVGS